MKYNCTSETKTEQPVQRGIVICSNRNSLDPDSLPSEMNKRKKLIRRKLIIIAIIFFLIKIVFFTRIHKKMYSSFIIFVSCKCIHVTHIYFHSDFYVFF